MLTLTLTEPGMAHKNRFDNMQSLEGHRDRLTGYAMMLARDKHWAQDMVQEAFVRTCESILSGKEISDPGPWLRGVVRNIWREEIRAKKKYPTLVSDMITETADRAAERKMLPGEGMRRENFEDCFSRLDPENRELVRLKYSENLSGQDIARRLGKGESWVRVKLHRIRKTLADCIERKELGQNG